MFLQVQMTSFVRKQNGRYPDIDRARFNHTTSIVGSFEVAYTLTCIYTLLPMSTHIDVRRHIQLFLRALVPAIVFLPSSGPWRAISLLVDEPLFGSRSMVGSFKEPYGSKYHNGSTPLRKHSQQDKARPLPPSAFSRSGRVNPNGDANAASSW
jgi:hypothetical protein